MQINDTAVTWGVIILAGGVVLGGLMLAGRAFLHGFTKLGKRNNPES
jgi:hypothetical protein